MHMTSRLVIPVDSQASRTRNTQRVLIWNEPIEGRRFIIADLPP